MKTKKPTLIQVGRHLININDIRCITQVRKDLYVVKFFSEANPEYPCWVEKKHIAALLEHFNIVTSDSEET